MEDEFKLGERVKVTGFIEDSNNLLIIREASASKIGKGNVITLIYVNTGNVNESQKGMIIQTSGIIDSLVNALPYGALLVLEVRIIAAHGSEIKATGDITMHADTGLIGNSDYYLKSPNQ